MEGNVVDRGVGRVLVRLSGWGIDVWSEQISYYKLRSKRIRSY